MYTLVQHFFNNGGVGDFEAILVPNDLIDVPMRALLNRMNGESNDDIEVEDLEKLDAFVQKHKAACMQFRYAVRVPKEGPITHMCQIFYTE